MTFDSTDPITSIAVLGAGGTMGFPIARNLAAAGMSVRAWNRSRDKAASLADDGVDVLDTAAEACRDSEVVLTMLADAEAVLEVARQALVDAPAETIWVQASTIGEVGTEQCAQLAIERGFVFIDAPVLGTKGPAEQGELVILASGPEGAVGERLEPVFDAIGKRTLWVGDAGAGTRLKLAINHWILTVVEGGAELFALAEGLGVSPALVFEAIEDGPLDLGYLRAKATAISDDDFEPAFRLALAAKDARLVQESVDQRGLDLPLVAAIRERLEQGVAEHGDKDMIATYLTSARESHLR